MKAIHRTFPHTMLMVLLTFLLPFSTIAQSTTPSPAIEFDETEHDFKEQKEGSDVSYVFHFKNTGTAPLILSDVKRSCGCTTPEWTNKPVMPGESGVITVRYDSKRVGPFHKSITVESNDPDHPSLIIKINGVIVAAEAGIPVKEKQGLPVEK